MVVLGQPCLALVPPAIASLGATDNPATKFIISPNFLPWAIARLGLFASYDVLPFHCHFTNRDMIR